MADAVSVDLGGRVAVVFGAAGGIGQAIAARLGAAGCRLALVDMHCPSTERAGALTFAADITNRAQVDAVAQGVQQAFGGVDVLVNAAGTNTPERTLDTMTAEQWEQVVAVDLTGVFHCVQAFLPLLRVKGGTVVTIVSTTAILVSPGGGTHYCAAKRALLSLNASINMEQGRHGVRACAVLPGEVDTPLIEKRPVAPSAERRATMLKPGDVAEAVLFAATRPAHVTVSDIVIWPTAQVAGIHTV